MRRGRMHRINDPVNNAVSYDHRQPLQIRDPTRFEARQFQSVRKCEIFIAEQEVGDSCANPKLMLPGVRLRAQAEYFVPEQLELGIAIAKSFRFRRRAVGAGNRVPVRGIRRPWRSRHRIDEDDSAFLIAREVHISAARCGQRNIRQARAGDQVLCAAIIERCGPGPEIFHCERLFDRNHMSTSPAFRSGGKTG